MMSRFHYSLLFLMWLFIVDVSAQWSTDHLSAARDELTAVRVGNKLLFAGGQKLNPTGHSKVVDILDLETMSWSVDSLSVGRDEMNSVALGNDAYFVGSSGNSTFSRKLDIYHLDTDSWESLDIPLPMYAKSITANGGKVFISGFEYVNIYDPETGEWTDHTLPQERNGAAAISLGSKVMFAGGYNDGANNRLHEVDVYDVDTEEWTVEFLSEGRSSIASIAFAGKAYFAGGVRDDYSVTKVVDIYDSVTGEWTVDSLSVARADFDVAELGGLLYFGGGQGTNGEGLFDIVDIYNPVTGQWTTSTLSLARSGLAAVSSDNAVYFAGGWPGSGYVDLVDIYTSTTSVDDDQNEISSIRISPNPVTDLLHIQFAIKTADRISINLLTTEGKIVKSIINHSNVPEGEFHHEVSLGDLNNGFYLLEVRGRNSGKVQKIVIEH